MATILTLDIKICGGRFLANSWSARIDVPDGFTLTELHSTIQGLVDFDDDHLYEFFSGRNWRDRKMIFGEHGGDGTEEVPLCEVFPLPKNQKLYYNFDFGDNWLFEISCRHRGKKTESNSSGPTLIQEKGRKPIQYPAEDEEG